MQRGKYRYRTKLREHAPEFVAALIPKGPEDCGQHEWYTAAERTWLCYHCRPGITHVVPWDEKELEARKHEARAMLIRAGAEDPARIRAVFH